MLRISITGIVLLFLSACAGKEDEVKVVEGEKSLAREDSIIQSAESRYDNRHDSLDALVDTVIVMPAELATKPFPEKVQGFLDVYEKLYSPSDLNNSHLLERFTSEYSLKRSVQKRLPVLSGNETTYPIAHLQFHRYADSASFHNVLNNWFSCFENGCDQVIPGKEPGKLNTQPVFAIINPVDREIIVLNYDCRFRNNDWEQVTTHLKNTFRGKDSYGLELGCAAPLKWFGEVPDKAISEASQ